MIVMMVIHFFDYVSLRVGSLILGVPKNDETSLVVGIPSPFASKSDWVTTLERGFVKAQGPPALALAPKYISL